MSAAAESAAPAADWSEKPSMRPRSSGAGPWPPGPMHAAT
jgi:hypothetical protein